MLQSVYKGAIMNIVRQSTPENHLVTRVPIVTKEGLVQLDPWWGSIQPISLHKDIKTIGELELIELLDRSNKHLLIDTRRPEYVEQTGVIPGAIAIHWENIVTKVEELKLGNDMKLILYCNGPQCAATPRAVRKLLDAGWSPKNLIYYRGGLMDWMGMGLPVEK